MTSDRKDCASRLAGLNATTTPVWASTFEDST